MPELESPQLLTSTIHQDVRGSHRKFFGVTPQALAFPGFEIHEVFMTTNNEGTIRGMHFQADVPQPKIIQVLSGVVHAVALCCDPADERFGTFKKFTLLEENNNRLYIPGRWALGYESYWDDTRVLYFAGADFSPTGDAGIDPFDPELGIEWTVPKERALLSERDQNLQSFAEFAEKLKEQA